MKGLFIMVNKLNNPHDKFFKASFGRLELVQDFLRNYLPDGLKEIINYDKLKLEDNTYIDQELEDYYSDILYQTEIKGEKVYLYFLFEHKSYEDKWSILQLLNYMSKIWMKIKDKNNSDSLPIIIPILFYHGESNKNIKKSFEEYFNSNNKDKFERFLPLFKVLFYDFSLKSNIKILGDFKLQYALKIIKMIRSKKINLVYKEITNYIIKLVEIDQEFVFQGIKYTFEVQEEFDLRSIAKLLEEQGFKEGDIIMTMAEKLRQEGRQEEKIEIARNMLKNDMAIEQVIKLTNLEKKQIILLKEEIQH